ACRKASATTGRIFRMWARAANSGTTPPYGAWRAICEATTLASGRPSRSSTAAEVSSQDDSMPRVMGGPSARRVIGACQPGQRVVERRRGDAALGDDGRDQPAG